MICKATQTNYQEIFGVAVKLVEIWRDAAAFLNQKNIDTYLAL